jgi:hypothetical protein
MRFTALKETLLSAQILFDLLLHDDTYRLVVHEESSTPTYQGDIQRLAYEHPTFRTFFLVGEAFFLPGINALRKAPWLNNPGTRLRTHLRSGVQAQWQLRPETLEITSGCLPWQDAEGHTIPITIQYTNYRPYGVYYLPHHVILRDRRAGFHAISVVKQLDINVPLPPDVFRMVPPTS